MKLFREYAEQRSSHYKSVVEWLAVNGHEINEENVDLLLTEFDISKWGRRLALGAAALGSMGSLPDASYGKEPVGGNQPATASANPNQGDTRIGKDGCLYARGFAKIDGQDAVAKMKAGRVSEMKAMRAMSAYINGQTTTGIGNKDGTITNTTTHGRIPGFETFKQTNKDGGIETIIKTVQPIGNTR